MLEANLSYKEILPKTTVTKKSPFGKDRRAGVGRKAKQKVMGWMQPVYKIQKWQNGTIIKITTE